MPVREDDVGYIQSLFVSAHDEREGPLCFRLAGRAWQVRSIEWSKSVLHVSPAEHGRVPSWLGFPGVLSQPICKSMRDVLGREAGESAWLTRTAAGELEALRQSYAGVLEDGEAPIEERPDEIIWHTFAGGAVNRLLAVGLERLCAKRWTPGNLSLRCKDLPVTAARDAVRGLPELDWDRLAAGAARGLTRGVVTKFQPCLPEEAEDRLLVDRLLDAGGRECFLTERALARDDSTVRPAT